MNCAHKKPGLAFWATVVVVVALVAYPLSFGPACWITARTAYPHRIFEPAYLPLGWCAGKIGYPAWHVLVPYARAGMPPASSVLVWTGSTIPSKIGTGWDPWTKY